MLYSEISKILAKYIFFLGIALCLPLCVAIYYEFFAYASHPQPHSTFAFIYTIVICFLIWSLLKWLGKRSHGKVFRRESLAAVGLIWFFSAFIGGMPFFFSKTFENPIDAYFEAMSGLTTTGASVMHPKEYDTTTGEEKPIKVAMEKGLVVKYKFYGTIKPVKDPITNEVLYSGVEAVSKAILFWRSFMQWLGGMGIVVLLVAILPALGVGGKVLFQAEVPGPMKDSFTPRIKETASVLWILYVVLTILEISLLMLTNNQIILFEAATIAFSTISTGGFCIRNTSIGHFGNGITEWIVVIFMILGGINFIHYFNCLRGKIYRIFEPELFLYLTILLLGSTIVVFYLVGEKEILLTGFCKDVFSLGDAIRHGCFQVVSAQTSTGFATADFNKWPFVTQIIMISLMYVGAMSGSTGGGIKVIRYHMLFKIVIQKVESIFRPDTVRSIYIGGNSIDEKVQTTVLSYFVIVIGFAMLGFFLYVLDGVDPITAFAVIPCMINNIGISFGMAGPTESFAFLSPISKILSSIWMVLGRLEFFALIILLLPGFWKRK